MARDMGPFGKFIKFPTRFSLVRLVTHSPELRPIETSVQRFLGASCGSPSKEAGMPRKGHSEEQIVFPLKRAESGIKVADICRNLGVTETTLYRWRKHYEHGGAELKELRQLREENTRLKKLVVDLSLDKHILQEVLSKSLKAAARRKLYHWIRDQYPLSERRACGLTGLSCCSARYQSRKDPQTALRMRLRELAAIRVSFGFERLTILLRREGWPVNRKRVYRCIGRKACRCGQRSGGRSRDDARWS